MINIEWGVVIKRILEKIYHLTKKFSLCILRKRGLIMIDHISFSVKNFEKSQNFYDKTLEILGYERLMNFDNEEHQVAGYGKNGRPSFWIGVNHVPSEKDKHESVGQAAGFHVGFLAPDVKAVHQWYEKCLELGGKDNGAPGPRLQYHPGYYGGFIIDPDGWRIEACFQSYEGK